ncbi:CotH kinase family protein [Candidatus Fermentibacteria bacterium]|nr:CotH kinase family protein [Candidatus Fermentibacteria bacterium]
MNANHLRIITCTLAASYSSVLGALTPPPHPLFDGDAVHEIRLTFHQEAWWDSLTLNYEGQQDPHYLAAEFSWAGIHFDSIGVRFKGNSSYHSALGLKKSFKLDIDEYATGQTVYGMDKLNLNNVFHDPTFVREPCCYELCSSVGLPTVRTNYAALYINDQFWGLYILVEQFDAEFIESRFGLGEEGNLWKGDPHGSLIYRGPNESDYYPEYELETNEEENDWSALVELIDGLNNIPPGELPEMMSSLMDVNSALAMLAIDNFTVNLDSYIGRCANYYMYHRDRDGRFVFSKWDLNESWGLFNVGNMSPDQLRHLDPFWLNPMPGEMRPLAARLWQVPLYRDIYLGHMRRLMAGAALPDTLLARMNALRDMIRPFVYADQNKFFSNAQFDAAMTTDIVQGGGPNPRIIPALEPFIRGRDAWLRQVIGEWMAPDGLVLNELMANNRASAADEHGDFDDWVEIANAGSAPVALGGMILTDNVGDPGSHFVFPDLVLQPGGYVVVWADNEPQQGPFHAPFGLASAGEEVHLLQGMVTIDQVTYPQLGVDVSWGRWPDGTGAWQLLAQATPGAQNENTTDPEEIVLFINEFLALNTGTNQDEAGEYDDWVEIYNPGPDPVQMGGLFLTDDLSFTTKWAFPDTVLESGAFMLLWCDDDDNGPFHASFKLSADGEELGLFGRISAGNALIDSHVFGPQEADRSEGRLPDGGDTWVRFFEPTPIASNNGAAGADPALPLEYALLPPCPNPFSHSTEIRFVAPVRGRMHLGVYDLSGRHIVTLADGVCEGGAFRITWDGREDHGRRVGAGAYLLRMEAGESVSTRRLVVLR